MNDSKPHRFYAFGDFQLDVNERVLSKNGSPVPLTHKVFDILLALVTNSGRIVTKDELMQMVWPDAIVEEGNLKACIYVLRQALGEQAKESRFIETLPKRGYRFVADVMALPDDEAMVIVAKKLKTEIIVDETFEDETDEALDNLRPTNGVVNKIALKDIVQNERAEVVASHPSLGTQTKTFVRRRKTLIAAAILIVVTVGLAFGLYRLSLTRSKHSSISFDRMRIARLTTTGNILYAVISPNGEYVCNVLHEEDGKKSLWLKHIPSGSMTRITEVAHVAYWAVAFSHDSNNIYYTIKDEKDDSHTGVYRMPLLGGSSQKIMASGALLCFSPDGKRMAFNRYDLKQPEAGGIYTANIDGSDEKHILVPNGFLLVHLQWSPDSASIIYVARKTDANDRPVSYVAQIPAMGGGEEKVIVPQSNRPIRTATWLADRSGLILLAIDPETEVQQIWRVSYPGGEWQRITNDMNNYNGVSVSADNSAMVVTQGTGVFNLWTASADGSNPRQITQSGVSYYNFSWTPDGRLVYTSQESGKGDIWLMNADGSERRQLTFNSGHNHSPSVSPDGRSIFFISNRSGKKQIWQMDIDGGNPRQLTNLQTDVFQLKCLPDGRGFVYSTWLPKSGWTLFKQLLDGSAPTQLTDISVGNWDISPDGKLLAFEYEERKDHSVIVRGIDGGPILKTFDFSPGWAMRWTRDGKALVYTSFADHKIMLQLLDAAPAKELMYFKTEHIFWFDFSPDGKQLVATLGPMTSDAFLIKFDKN